MTVQFALNDFFKVSDKLGFESTFSAYQHIGLTLSFNHRLHCGDVSFPGNFLVFIAVLSERLPAFLESLFETFHYLCKW